MSVLKDMSFLFTIRRTEKGIERTERHVILNLQFVGQKRTLSVLKGISFLFIIRMTEKDIERTERHVIRFTIRRTEKDIERTRSVKSLNTPREICVQFFLSQ